MDESVGERWGERYAGGIWHDLGDDYKTTITACLGIVPVAGCTSQTICSAESQYCVDCVVNSRCRCLAAPTVWLPHSAAPDPAVQGGTWTWRAAPLAVTIASSVTVLIALFAATTPRLIVMASAPDTVYRNSQAPTKSSRYHGSEHLL